MDTRTEPVMILEASGHSITAAAHAAPGMESVGAAKISELQKLLQGSRAVEPTEIAGLLLGKVEQESRVHSLITGISSCLHS